MMNRYITYQSKNSHCLQEYNMLKYCKIEMVLEKKVLKRETRGLLQHILKLTFCSLLKTVPVCILDNLF
jgi:hypothetical protein